MYNTPSKMINMKQASKYWWYFQLIGVSLTHASTTGTMTRAPTASPTHHVHQVYPKLDHSTTSPAQRHNTPTDALITVATIAVRVTNLNTS